VSISEKLNLNREPGSDHDKCPESKVKICKYCLNLPLKACFNIKKRGIRDQPPSLFELWRAKEVRESFGSIDKLETGELRTG